MRQTALKDWNIALPDLSSAPAGSVLPVVVGETTFGIPLDKVSYVDYPDTLTPLPLAAAPVEGLTRFNGRPLVQISVAQALHLTPKSGIGRIVVMRVPRGEVALHVDEVLGFVAAGSAAREDAFDAAGETAPAADSMPLLKLEDVLPWLDRAEDEGQTPAAAALATEAARTGVAGHILLVSTGEKVVALLAESVDRIEEVNASLRFRHPDSDADLLIKIDDYLLPARSLARILNCEGGEERYALVVHGAEQPWALLVGQVLRLERVTSLHGVFSPSGAETIWYLDESGTVTEVIDIKEFFGVRGEHTRITVALPQSQRYNLPQMSANLSTEGVRIYCGETVCILPLDLVKRTIGNLGEIVVAERAPDQANLIPIIDGTMLLDRHPKSSEHCNILLSLCQDRQVILAVDRASLQPTLSLGNWLPLAALPPPTAYLFDAASYDEAEGRWVLRVTNKWESFFSAWATKRTLVNAMLGWIGPEALEREGR